MEFRHFSHNHGLVFHQIAQGSEIHCSGCKSTGSGNVYVCWQCGYFIHEQCFRAPRSLKHPSHPHHPLTLVPFPTHPSGSFFCNSCNLGGDGFSYSCSECDFDLHVHCAHLPNPNPHLPPSPVPNPNFPVPNGAQNYNCHPQNPIYPPPIQASAFPTYPPPPYNPTIPNETQSYPPQPQTTTTYPPIPNNPYPNFTPPNITLPNQAPNYNIPQQIPQNPGYPPNQNNPIPPYTNQNAPPQNFAPPPANPPTTNQPPPPPPPSQPNQTVPTYSTVVNATTTTTNPPPLPPPAAPQPTIIKHFSHPHVLKAMEIAKENAKVCSACECELSGSAYCCTESYCTFNLHKTCFDSAREVKHKSHLQHPLTLVTAPPYADGFTCNACLKDGKAFAYTCATCNYDLHIDCVQWPETVTRPDHKHVLTLYYSSPASAAAANQEVTFVCDVCSNPVHEMAWMYYCRECDFGTHLECVASGIKQQQQNVSSGEKSEEELIDETALKFAVLQLLIEAQSRKAILELSD